jgi:hypothetical protein
MTPYLKVFGILSLCLMAQTASAIAQPIRAVITGGGGNGRCTVELSVDGTAEVELTGAKGLLRTFSAQEAVWQRFECNRPLPANPVDFRVVRIEGRGSVRLVRDPSYNGGTAAIRIDDPKGGRGRYVLDLEWRNYGGPQQHDPWQGPGRSAMTQAVRNCQDSVRDRLDRDGYRFVSFGRVVPDDNPGRRDWVTGTASATRRQENRRFQFSCSVDFNSGRVRSWDLR